MAKDFFLHYFFEISLYEYMYDFYGGIKLLKSPKSEEVIGVEWRFDDGTKSVFYPSDIKEEWFVVLVENVREMWANDKKERYHQAFNVESSLFEGAIVWDQNTPPHIINLQEEQDNVDAFINNLTEKEKQRLQMKYDEPSLKLSEIARRENVSKTSIFKQFKKIREKFIRSEIYRNMKNI